METERIGKRDKYAGMIDIIHASENNEDGNEKAYDVGGHGYTTILTNLPGM